MYQQQGPEIMYVDNARTSAPSLEQMMAGVRVLGDPTHLMRRFIRACPSGHSLIDPYNVEEMFINISSDPENPHWVAFWGCSKREGYHPGLHATFKGNNYTPSMARAMVAVHTLRHNITCGQRFFGLPDHGWEIWREDPDFSPHIVDSGGADPDVNDLLQELPTSGNVPSSQGLHGRSESHADAGSNLSSASTPRHAHIRPSVAPLSTPEETELRETAKQFGILWGWTYQESVHQQGSCGLCKRPLSESGKMLAVFGALATYTAMLRALVVYVVVCLVKIGSMLPALFILLQQALPGQIAIPIKVHLLQMSLQACLAWPMRLRELNSPILARLLQLLWGLLLSAVITRVAEPEDSEHDVVEIGLPAALKPDPRHGLVVRHQADIPVLQQELTNVRSKTSLSLFRLSTTLREPTTCGMLSASMTAPVATNFPTASETKASCRAVPG
ncbi:hypothetical protein WJX74_009880 [Apatococcus lobatus]|uniref:Uncharacterized protein n=1 Tax=Apatococcus lobatus TaxID=904363 RepID=A0AAW1RZE6_9CHLO